MQHVLNDAQLAVHSRVQFRCSKCGRTTVLDLPKPQEQTQSVTASPALARAGAAPRMDATVLSQSVGLALPKDKTLTISVIAGPSKGLTYQLTKPTVVVGRAGGGADIEVNDPEISRQHCALEVKQDVVRLRDLDSTNGTYIADARVCDAELGHLSEFRSGTSLFLVTIFPKRD